VRSVYYSKSKEAAPAAPLTRCVKPFAVAVVEEVAWVEVVEDAVEAIKL